MHECMFLFLTCVDTGRGLKMSHHHSDDSLLMLNSDFVSDISFMFT